MKVLGTTPKQLKRALKRERRFLTAIAIPLGLVCAAMNFSRNRKKAFDTALSLSLTGILLLCISAYASSADETEIS